MAKTPLSEIKQFAPCSIYIRGKVNFSRVASFVEGAELERQNQERRQRGYGIHQSPYISISLTNPMIMDNGKLPPQVKSVIQERFYTDKNGNLAFSQESKGTYLPTVLYSNLAGDLAGQGIADSKVPLQGELAKGLDVTVGLSLFQTNYGNPGLGIKCILVNEPIRYYSNTGLENDFADLGITYVPPTAVSQPMPTVEPMQPMSTSEVALTQQVNEVFGNAFADMPPVASPMMSPATSAMGPSVSTPVYSAPQRQANFEASAPQIQRPIRYY